MRGMTYLLRLVLPDRPGSLGAVATALGAAGVDIESLDVIERAAEHNFREGGPDVVEFVIDRDVEALQVEAGAGVGLLHAVVQ